MNAAIKLNHHQYLQVLEQLLTAKVNLPEGKINTVKLPLFNLIALLVTIYTQYTEQHQLQPLTLFVLHYFVSLQICSKSSTPLPSKCIGTCRE